MQRGVLGGLINLPWSLLTVCATRQVIVNVVPTPKQTRAIRHLLLDRTVGQFFDARLPEAASLTFHNLLNVCLPRFLPLISDFVHTTAVR